MKILVISAQYPPYHSGGYSIRCKDIMDTLFARGHEILVLTTTIPQSKIKDKQSTYRVKRKLHDRSSSKFFPQEVLNDIKDTKVLESLLKKFKPDVIYLGYIYNLSKALIPYISSLNKPVILDEGGASMRGAWTDNGRWFRFIGDYKSKVELLNKIKPIIIRFICLLGKGRIQCQWFWPKRIQVIFNSQSGFNKAFSEGLPVQDAKIIYPGIDLKRFPFPDRKTIDNEITIVLPGRIEPRKGQLDAVRLLSILRKQGIDACLTLIGEKSDIQYFDTLEEEIKELNLTQKVFIIPMVPQDELVSYYSKSEICFFPSIQTSGFSRIPLEAMACGSIIISYGFEGSSEIINHNEDGFLIEPGEYFKITDIINRFKSNPQFSKKIIEKARKKVENNYDLNRYVKN